MSRERVRVRARRAIAASVACWAGLAACAGPSFEISDLPEAPIAFVYRTVEETDRVLDLYEQRARAEREAQLGEFAHQGIEVEGERVEQLLGFRTQEDAERDAVGRLFLYHAPAHRLEAGAFTARGARPLQWSPDHTRLLFSAPHGEHQALFEWDRERREVRPLVLARWSCWHATYGPDRAFAYTQSETPKDQPVRMRVWVQFPGEAARPITEGPLDGSPAWSPRGDRIVYAAKEGERTWLRWVDPRTGEGGRLVPGRSPVFTPDGAWIVYSALTRGTWKLWRIHADGSGRLRFGDSPFHEHSPSVSPDGRYVVYAGTLQEESAVSRLFVRPLDGSPDRQLDFSGSGINPVW